MLQLRIKELREKAGLSQYKLATILGVAQSTVGMWESGKNRPEYEMLIKLADYFDCSTDYLLGRVDEPNIEIKKVPSEDGTTELDIGVSKGTDLTQDEITALRELLKKNKQGQ